MNKLAELIGEKGNAGWGRSVSRPLLTAKVEVCKIMIVAEPSKSESSKRSFYLHCQFYLRCHWEPVSSECHAIPDCMRSAWDAPSNLSVVSASLPASVLHTQLPSATSTPTQSMFSHAPSSTQHRFPCQPDLQP